MEPNQIDILAFTVLRNLEHIDDTQETRLSRQLRSDGQKTDRLDRIHFDLTFVHTVPGAHFDVGASPESDTASDFSATNAGAKTLGEDHEESLLAAQDRHFDTLADDLWECLTRSNSRDTTRSFLEPDFGPTTPEFEQFPSSA